MDECVVANAQNHLRAVFHCLTCTAKDCHHLGLHCSLVKQLLHHVFVEGCSSASCPALCTPLRMLLSHWSFDCPASQTGAVAGAEGGVQANCRLCSLVQSQVISAGYTHSPSAKPQSCSTFNKLESICSPFTASATVAPLVNAITAERDAMACHSTSTCSDLPTPTCSKQSINRRRLVQCAGLDTHGEYTESDTKGSGSASAHNEATIMHASQGVDSLSAQVHEMRIKDPACSIRSCTSMVMSGMAPCTKLAPSVGSSYANAAQDGDDPDASLCAWLIYTLLAKEPANIQASTTDVDGFHNAQQAHSLLEGHGSTSGHYGSAGTQPGQLGSSSAQVAAAAACWRHMLMCQDKSACDCPPLAHAAAHALAHRVSCRDATCGTCQHVAVRFARANMFS